MTCCRRERKTLIIQEATSVTRARVSRGRGDAAKDAEDEGDDECDGDEEENGVVTPDNRTVLSSRDA